MAMKFWRAVFSEPTGEPGQPSFSRVATAFLVAFGCGWVTFLVWKNHTLPELVGLAVFITVLYTSNKVAGIFGPKPPDACPPAAAPAPPVPPAPPPG